MVKLLYLKLNPTLMKVMMLSKDEDQKFKQYQPELKYEEKTT